MSEEIYLEGKWKGWVESENVRMLIFAYRVGEHTSCKILLLTEISSIVKQLEGFGKTSKHDKELR